MAAITVPNHVNMSPYYSVKLRRFGAAALVTLLALVIVITYLLPFGNMALMSLKDVDQIVAGANGSILPQDPATFNYEGEEYPVYTVPTEQGNQTLALVKKGRQSSEFIDPANPEAGLIEWQGSWRTL